MFWLLFLFLLSLFLAISFPATCCILITFCDFSPPL
jgi:hypothetical protein